MIQHSWGKVICQPLEGGKRRGRALWCLACTPFHTLKAAAVVAVWADCSSFAMRAPRKLPCLFLPHAPPVMLLDTKLWMLWQRLPGESAILLASLTLLSPETLLGVRLHLSSCYGQTLYFSWHGHQGKGGEGHPSAPLELVPQLSHWILLLLLCPVKKMW